VSLATETAMSEVAEPALAALGSAAEDADAGACPKIFDEPAPVVVGLVEVDRAYEG
jgi:hypothetical protein